MTHKLNTLLKLPVILFILFATTAVASAEERVDVGATVTLNVMTSSTTTSSVGLSAFWMFFELATSTGDGMSSSTRTVLAPVAATETYVNNNAIALQGDITVGGGQSVDDLAKMCSVPKANTKAFGKLLQRNRKVLVPMLSKKFDRATTVKFLKTIEQGMMQDKQLKGLVASL